jgi:hypothetical protein
MKIAEVKSGLAGKKSSNSMLSAALEDFFKPSSKSSAMAQWKHRMTKAVNFDFQNLTKNVLDQKDSKVLKISPIAPIVPKNSEFSRARACACAP